jgi:hypothetical protein
MRKQFFLIAVLLIATLQTQGLSLTQPHVRGISSSTHQTSRFLMPDASSPCATTSQGFVTRLPLATKRLEMQSLPSPEAFNAKPCPIPLAAGGNNGSMGRVIIRHKR